MTRRIVARHSNLKRSRARAARWTAPPFAAVLLASAIGAARASASRTDGVPAARFAQLALDCVHREHPNKIAHVLNGDEDARPPRELTPAVIASGSHLVISDIDGTSGRAQVAFGGLSATLFGPTAAGDRAPIPCTHRGAREESRG